MGQYGVLSPEEQTELRTLITPRFAQLLMKMFGPEMEPHLQPYLADDMAGGMPGEQAPEFAGVGDQGMFQPPGKLDPNIQPAGLTSGDAVGGGTPANALADIYRAGPRPRGV
jgi:hypothetical protein